MREGNLTHSTVIVTSQCNIPDKGKMWVTCDFILIPLSDLSQTNCRKEFSGVTQWRSLENNNETNNRHNTFNHLKNCGIRPFTSVYLGKLTINISRINILYLSIKLWTLMYRLILLSRPQLYLYNILWYIYVFSEHAPVSLITNVVISF